MTSLLYWLPRFAFLGTLFRGELKDLKSLKVYHIRIYNSDNRVKIYHTALIRL